MINNWISTINSNRENLAIITYEPSIEQLIFTLKSSLSNIVSINYNHTESIDITKILKDFSKYSEGEQIQTALYIKSVAKPNISELAIQLDQFFSIALKSPIAGKSIIKVTKLISFIDSTHLPFLRTIYGNDIFLEFPDKETLEKYSSKLLSP